MTNTLLFTAYHSPTFDDKGKVSTPACVMTIKECNEIDSLGSPIIAKLNQRYARPNKKFDNVIKLDMFNGKQGIKQDFYSENEIAEYLKILIDENYRVKRSTSHLENELADTLFKVVMAHSTSIVAKNGGFKLPS